MSDLSVNKYILIDNEDDFIDLSRFIKGTDIIYLDTETTGIDPYTAQLLLMSLRTKGQTFVIDFRTIPPDMLYSYMKETLESAKVVMHNATFDWRFLYHNSMIYMRNMFCTMVAEQVLKAGLPEAGETNLKVVCYRRLGIDMSKDERDYFINYNGYLPKDAFTYAAKDADVLELLYEDQQKEAVNKDLLRTLELEMCILPNIARVEYVGVGFDKERMLAAIPVYEAKVEELDRDIQRIALQFSDRIVFTKNGFQVINPSSNPQMIALMNNLGIEVDRTDKSVLSTWDQEYALKKIKAGGSVDFLVDALLEDDQENDAEEKTGYAHPFLRKYALYKVFSNMGSKAKSLVEHINPVTNRIHSGIQQCGAARTGRMSSRSPNTQNQQRNDVYGSVGIPQYAVRPMFIPRSGRRFVIVDFKGIEAAILAAMSQDENLLYYIAPGKDIHTYVASNLFGRDVIKGKSSIDDLLRHVAKTITYSIMYGATGWRIYKAFVTILSSVGIHITKNDADEWIVMWKKLFPKAGAVLDEAAKDAVTKGYVTTVIGRRRQWDLQYIRSIGVAAINAAMRGGSNSKIQGSAADILKQSIVLYEARVDHTRADIVMLVHDEMVVEADVDYADTVLKDVIDCFEEAGVMLFPVLPKGTITGDGHISDCYDK